MVTPRDVPADAFIAHLKERLKQIKAIEPPPWARFAKTGAHRERPPEQPDIWWIRCASILRRMYLDGPIGVERLRTYYGGRRRRGRRPARFRKGSGAWVRKALQQLEEAGLVERVERKGRQLTKAGRSFLDRVAYEVYRKWKG
jgi:small subunit ribosomal protein S19e